MAADTFQIKRGSTAQVNAYVAANGEPVLDTTLKQLHIGDGVTAGGTVIGTLTTAFMATLLDDADAATALLTLGASPLASPTFTGIPAGPTAAPGTNTTQLATTAFVTAADALKANLASPTFTGVPAAPTAALGTNTTQIATMAALQARILGTVSQSGGVPTGTIIETGANANGTYTKWADGTMICHRQTNHTSVAVTQSLGSSFYSLTGLPALAFAATFIAPPSTVTSVIAIGLPMASTEVTAATTTTGPQVLLMYPVSTTVNVSRYEIAIGRWF